MGQNFEITQFNENDKFYYYIKTIKLPREYENYRVNYIFNDKQGFVWFGCDKGILRYDGSRFNDFTQEYINATTSFFTEVMCIRQDASGVIWFGNQQGLVKYDPANNTFIRFLDDSGPDGSWAWNQIMYMIYRNGYIWIASNHGISRFNTLTGKFDHHFNISELEGNMTAVNDLYLGDDKTLYFSTEFSHFKYDIATSSVTEMKNSPPAYCSFYRDDFGNKWLSAYTGLFLYDSIANTFKKMLDDPDDPDYLGSDLCVFLKHNQNYGYWIGVPGGFYKYSNAFEKEYFLRHDPDYVTAFRVDEEGTPWFATSEGIYKVIRKHRNFKCVPSDYLEDEPVSSIVENNHVYWFTNYREIHAYTHDFRHIKTLKFHNGLYDRRINPSIVKILFDLKGRLWMGSVDKGLYVCEDVNTNSQLTRIFPGSGEGSDIPGNVVTSLYKDTKGRIWIGTMGHLPCYFDPDQNKIIHIKFLKEPKFPAGFVREMSVNEELENGIMIAYTNNGLFAFQAPLNPVTTDTFEISYYLNYFLPAKKNVVYPIINSLCKSEKSNILWASTWESGFLCFRINGNQLSPDLLDLQYEITTDEGLNTNDIMSIAEDQSGNLWLGTNSGLVRFEPETGIFSFFGKEDGLESEIFNPAAVHQDADGKILFGIKKGIVSFYPDSIRYNMKIPPVLITDIYIDDNSIYGDSSLTAVFHERQQPLKLKYADRNLNIEFACLNYIHPEKNQFRYRLDGYTDGWVMNGNHASVLFSDLKPGRYTFHVEAGTGYGVWNHEGDSVAFIIRKPPWLTVPAFLLYLAIAASLIYLTNLYVQSKAKFLATIELEKKENEQVREMDEMKSRFFANISHEFRTPLTLIMGHVRDLEKQAGADVRMKRSALAVLGRNARRLLLLINQLLDIAKLEKNALQLDLKKGDLSEWVRILVSSFHSLADSQGIQFIEEIEETVREVCFDPDKTDKIITNLLSNAFKFTGKGERVEFRLSIVNGENDGQEFASMEVTDTGKGMEKDQLERIFDRFYQVSSSDTREAEGTGIGLSLTRELVELMHGTITVESEPGKGTTFEVMFPVSEECFPGEEVQEMQAEEPFFSSAAAESEKSDNGVTKDETFPHEKVILVVEDNSDLRKYLQDQLSGEYSVLTAEDGKQGLDLAREKLPDLVISDLMMPVMDGMEMMDRLKQNQATNHIPVIMLTAKADKESKLEGLKTGADDYIIKPFECEELIARVRNLIQQREILRNTFIRNYLLETDRKESSMQFGMLREILKTIDRHLGDPEFNISAFGKELGMTRSQLFRKVQSITGTSPNELVRIARMKRAAHLFRTTDLNVAQVMYEVGMNNPSHFAKSFKRYFGVNPTKYRNH